LRYRAQFPNDPESHPAFLRLDVAILNGQHQPTPISVSTISSLRLALTLGVIQDGLIGIGQFANPVPYPSVLHFTTGK
jgi:hypothetical protein